MKYVIDIDGTICNEGGNVEDRLPFIERIERFNQLYDEGHTVVYHTARGLSSGRGEPHYRPITEKQLDVWGVKYHELSFKKHDADVFIDDKCINVKDFIK